MALDREPDTPSEGATQAIVPCLMDIKAMDTPAILDVPLVTLKAVVRSVLT